MKNRALNIEVFLSDFVQEEQVNRESRNHDLCFPSIPQVCHIIFDMFLKHEGGAEFLSISLSDMM